MSYKSSNFFFAINEELIYSLLFFISTLPCFIWKKITLYFFSLSLIISGINKAESIFLLV